MKKKSLLLALLVTPFLFAGCRTATADLPKLEDGFHWEEFKEIGVAVPCPDGWHRAVSKGYLTYTGSVSMENFKKEGLFKTGFTVQFFAKIKERTGNPPSMLAVAMGQEISDAKYNTVLMTKPLRENGKLKSCIIRYRNAPALGNKITVHKFFVANDTADLLYIYTFESPDETWDLALESFGVPIMSRIVMKQ